MRSTSVTLGTASSAERTTSSWDWLPTARRRWMWAVPPEDDEHRASDEIQKITDKYIETIDSRLSKKETELMEV